MNRAIDPHTCRESGSLYYSRRHRSPDLPPDDPILLHILGSRLRTRLFTALLEEPGRNPWFRDLQRQCQTGMGALHHELILLKRIGLIRDEYAGGARFFKVNENHPLTAPLRALIFASRETDAYRKLGSWEHVRQAKAAEDAAARTGPDQPAG